MKNSILKSAILTCALGASLTASAQARYIFYFIGDGMGMGHVNVAERYLRDVRHSDKSLLMMTFPVASQVRTYSGNSPITDSAAAGTALSTGHKTNNWRVAADSEGNNLYSISRDFLKAGYEVGVATSVAGDDATPAVFYAHSTDRGDKYHIAPQAIESGIRFLGAATFRGMAPRDGEPSSWLEERQTRGGYTLAMGYDQYRNLPDKSAKTLMLSPNPQGDQVGYTIDSIPGAMTCAELTAACLETLQTAAKSNNSPGFFMMVEGGNIDWAAHANDGGAVIQEVLNFQNAIDVAYQFYLAHPDDTLIVITADHDTGGLALGRNDNKHNPDLSLYDFQRISKDRFAEYCKTTYKPGAKADWGEMKDFLAANLGFWGGISLSDEETEELKKSFELTFVSGEAQDEETWYKNFDRFTVDVFNTLNRHGGIGFTTSSHTGNFVPLYAIGRDAMLFTRNLDNIEIPGLILKAAGIRPQK